MNSEKTIVQQGRTPGKSTTIDLTANGFNIRSQADINRMNALQAFQSAIKRSKKVKR